MDFSSGLIVTVTCPVAPLITIGVSFRPFKLALKTDCANTLVGSSAPATIAAKTLDFIDAPPSPVQVEEFCRTAPHLRAASVAACKSRDVRALSLACKKFVSRKRGNQEGIQKNRSPAARLTASCKEGAGWRSEG